MRIKNKTASLIFKLVLICVGCFGLLQQVGGFSGQGDPYFWFYFTNLSNLAVLLYLIADVIYLLVNRKRADAVTFAPRLKYACMMAITVTFLIAHFLLNGGMVFIDGEFHLTMLIVHYIVPILTIADWLLFDEKGTMGKFDPFVWVVLPLVYLGYVLILVYGLGMSLSAHNPASRFPYPFIDIDAQGIPATCVTVIILVIIFIALGYVYKGIDRLLARKTKK